MESNRNILSSGSGDAERHEGEKTEHPESAVLQADLSNILLHSKCAIFVLRKDSFNILFANNSAVVKTGHSQDSLYGMTLTEIFPEIDEKELTKRLLPLWNEEKTEIEIEAEFQNAKEETGNASLSFQAVKYGKEDCLLLYVKDITTERKQLNELMKYQEVFNAYTNIYMETELDGTILYITPSVKNLLGFEQEEVVGMNSGGFYSDPKLREKLIPFILEHGSISSNDIQIRHKNGNYISVKASVIMDRDKNGNPIFKSTFHDITELKKVQEELQEKNNRLEVLQKVQKEILKSRSVEGMIRSAIVQYRTLPVPTARIAVSLFDEFNDVVTIYLLEGSKDVEKKRGKLTSSFTYNLLKSNHTKKIGLFEDLILKNTESVLELKNHSYISFPLLISDKLIGALTFEFGEQLPASREYMDLLSEISRQLAIAVNNITLNEELKSSIDRFKVLYEQEAMGVLETTVDGRILDANQKMLDILKLKGHELYGLTIGDLAYNQADFIYEDKMIREVVINSNDSLAFTKRFKNTEENVVYAKIWITKVKGGTGENDYLLYFVEDRTELHKAEASRLSALIEGQENERKRIAQELHDGLGQVLSVIKLNLFALESVLPPEKLSNLTKFADLAIKEYRAVSHNLIPPLLENNGLSDALRDLCGNVSASGAHKIKLRCNIEHEIPKLYAIETYRIIQELMNNTLKHAEAENINLTVDLSGNVLSINYSDNGKGFDLEEVRRGSWSMRKGIGISNIEARVKLLNGSIDIIAEKNKGASFHIQFFINEV